MSINVDKMDPKNVASPRKPKTLKRRKKTSSMSDLSIGSISPKRKFYSNNFSEENPSSPEVSSRDSQYSPPGAFNELFRYSCNIPQNDDNSQKVPTTVPQQDTQLDDDSVNRSIGYTNGLVAGQTDSIRHSDTLNQNNGTDSDSNASVNKGKRRTTEDFYLFCQFILEYENYNGIANQEALRNSTHSPLDSTGSATESTTSSAAIEESNQVIDNIDNMDTIDVSKDDSAKEVDISNTLVENKLDASKNISAMDVSSTNDDITDESDIDADSYNLITCYCGKPYAARPMIECSQCLTWLHLSCAKVKRKHIPDIFICVKCVKSGHPKDLQGSEPKENNRSKRSSNSTQTRSDKLENTILQPLNVEASYETSTKCLENIKSSSAGSISVKYK